MSFDDFDYQNVFKWTEYCFKGANEIENINSNEK